MALSKIEWTDVTWNPVTGCTKVSQGCKNCYAETVAKRFWKDRKFTDVVCHEDRLEQPLHWKKPRMIFVNSMSDLFHEDVPFEFIDRIMTMIAYTNHIYQVLTKRPKRMLEYFSDSSLRLRLKIYIENLGNKRGYKTKLGDLDPLTLLDNLWLGVSVEDQKTANERIPILLETPAAVRWISAEPLLSSIDIREYLHDSNCLIKENGNCNCSEPREDHLDWVVVGGESGPKARECNVFWISDIVGQCKKASIPVFVKQLGSKGVFEKDDGVILGAKIIIDGKGKNDKIEDFPEYLKIRQYPRELPIERLFYKLLIDK